MPHEIPNQVSFRNHPGRKIQTFFQDLTPGIIDVMYHRGFLDNTAIADVLGRGEALLPDPVTLTGLQITIEASRKLVNGDYKAIGRMTLGAGLDLFDGSLARHLNLASPEGAVKDVFADRIAELYMAELIEDVKSKYEGGRADLSELKKAFQLSTLTKAASEILGVHTSEGGQGSMIERRKTLLLILCKLGKINSGTTVSDKSRAKILSQVNHLTDSLINGSRRRAVGRIDQILEALPFVDQQWNNPSLDCPISPAAIEARKYAAVVRMNQREGLDMVRYLNTMAHREVFPSWEELSQRYGYIDDCIKDTEPFLEAAFSLAHPSR